MSLWAPALKQARRSIPALAACLILLASGAAARPASDALEYAVKATYLYKFAPFIEWPEAALPSPSSPIALCVAGDDPFGDLLDQAVGGQRIGQHPIEVHRMQTARPDSGCHIMYVAGSAVQPVAQALDAIRGTPVLTVTDSASGADAKGIVHFVIRDNRVRFEIDDHAAAENGITISSKVLSLATSVRPRS